MRVNRFVGEAILVAPGGAKPSPPKAVATAFGDGGAFGRTVSAISGVRSTPPA